VARIPKLVWGEGEERKLSELDFKAFFFFFLKKKRTMCVCSSHYPAHRSYSGVTKCENGGKLFWVEIIDILKGGGRTEINVFY